MDVTDLMCQMKSVTGWLINYYLQGSNVRPCLCIRQPVPFCATADEN
jgi:hypothetical protein